MAKTDYQISIDRVATLPIAAVRARLRARTVPAQFKKYLDQVYAAAGAGSIKVDGQNIFVYHGKRDVDEEAEIDIDFGVGATKPFSPVGAVTYTQTPGGTVATTTHWGEYSE